MTSHSVDLSAMTPTARATWLAAFELGFAEGHSAGLRLANEEWTGRLEISKAIALQVARSRPFDELADHRGDHDRAKAQRALLLERGIVA